jgi:hypothetical protein
VGALAATVSSAALALSGCGGDDEATPATTLPAGFRADRCLVRLHGKGETGAEPVIRDGLAELSPTGNDRAGDGHQWRYVPDDRFDEARAAVAAAIEAAGCERVALDGFSNGGGFAGALVCRGETFGGTLVGVVIDDPVTDEAVLGCAPAPGVERALYWTGALDDVAPGADCDDIGWTCAGGTIIGVDAYAAELGVPVQPSPFDDHRWFRDAPELEAWLAG